MGLLDEDEENRPKPNIKGSFDCQVCNGSTTEAHFDARKKTLTWWCDEEGHESVIEEFGL